MAAVAGVAAFGSFAGLGADSGWRALAASFVGIPTSWVLAVAAQGGYRSAEQQRFSVRFRIVMQAAAWFLAATLMLAVVTADHTLELAALGILGVAVIVSLAGGWLARATQASRRRSGSGSRRVLAVGSPRVVAEYAAAAASDTASGILVIATMTPRADESPSATTVGIVEAIPREIPLQRSAPEGASAPGTAGASSPEEVPPISGVALSVLARAEESRADEVVVLGGTDLTGTDFRDLAWLLDERGLGLSVLPVTWDVAPHRVRVDQMSGLPHFVLTSARRRPASQLVKGGVDRVLAAFALILLLPVLALIAAAIRLDSAGPALFRQERVGRDGHVFTMLKFRTMREDAETVRAELEAQNRHGSGPLFKMERDPRVTRVGAFLRRTSLDELPQFINVLTGEMSLVGPRPALPREVAVYDPRAQRRLAVKPGVTGLWQVSGRSNLAWAPSVDLDLRYIERWSVALDISIIFRTFGAVLLRKGAY